MIFRGNKMKIGKVILIILILFALSIPGFFVYTRFCLDKFEMSGNGKNLIIKNSMYTRSDYMSVSDEENLGKTIGIAVEGKRTITDYIWPFWVMEYNNDKKHNRIFVRGLMGSGGVYIKDSK
jgi:hypothetical protein